MTQVCVHCKTQTGAKRALLLNVCVCVLEWGWGVGGRANNSIQMKCVFVLPVHLREATTQAARQPRDSPPPFGCLIDCRWTSAAASEEEVGRSATSVKQRAEGELPVGAVHWSRTSPV